jgi:hypothetical protein
MSEYKLYSFDGTRRILRPADTISATSDEEAIAIAKGLDMTMACELWQGRRLVATIAAAKSP